MNWTTFAGPLAVIAIIGSTAAPSPAAHAKNGDTHIAGQGIEQTLDCNDATVIVNGTSNVINAKGSCWAVTLMGSGNTVYGWDQTIFHHSSAAIIWDRGREPGMTNRLQQVPR